MLSFKGKCAECLVMIDDVEETASAQIAAFLDSPALRGAKIRIMPDVHAGVGAVIGFTATVTDKIIPNMIGADIGCGIESYCLGGRPPDLKFADFDKYVRANVPSGFAVRDTISKSAEIATDDIAATADSTDQDVVRVLRSLGTLGGGNHFIELGRDDVNRNLWLTIHTGSRNFGLKIAGYHQAKAVANLGKLGGLEYLEAEQAEAYFAHMKIAQRFASVNRSIIAEVLLAYFDLTPDGVESVKTVHNYIDFEDEIIRKGAIAAHLGQRVVIPWNMRDGLVIGTGKGNAEWNESAPHGAGRVMARGKALRTLDVAAFEKTMADANIWSSCVGKDTLDEAPDVYKNYQTIKDAIGDTVNVDLTVKPLYNFKAS